jgi:cytochrome c oxidase cbb3-type subunit 3
MRRCHQIIRTLIAMCIAFTFASCEREERSFRVETPSADATTSVRLTDFQPGQPEPPPPTPNGYEENAYQLAQGQTLYLNYNCIGCHAMGGGGIGPPLMDDKWIYGALPDQIYATISQGRPNGMPSFGGHISTDQIWQLVAYVEAMSARVPATAAPGRNDDQTTAEPESRRARQDAVQTGHR